MTAKISVIYPLNLVQSQRNSLAKCLQVPLHKLILMLPTYTTQHNSNKQTHQDCDSFEQHQKKSMFTSVCTFVSKNRKADIYKRSYRMFPQNIVLKHFTNPEQHWQITLLLMSTIACFMGYWRHEESIPLFLNIIQDEQDILQ